MKKTRTRKRTPRSKSFLMKSQSPTGLQLAKKLVPSCTDKSKKAIMEVKSKAEKTQAIRPLHDEKPTSLSERTEGPRALIKRAEKKASALKRQG